jgi:hypothetical protein
VGRTAPCADTNGDGQVDVDDVLNLLSEFGMSSLTTDIDDSSTVGVADLMLVLADFGTFVDESRTSCADHGPADGMQGDVCGTVTQISTDGPGTTYRLGLSLSGNAKSVYTIYGDEDFSMVIPPAYQESAPFGTNFGGVDPAFIAVSASAAFDSWLTVGIVDGDNAGALGSVGFDWETWTMDSGIDTDAAADFWMDHRAAPEGDIVIAQITLNGGFTASVGAQGKSVSGADWHFSQITFMNGMDSCALCPPGFYSNDPDSTVCKVCSAGSFSNAAGSTACISCGSGTYAPLAAVECSSCVPPRADLDQSPSTPCTPCPGAISSGGICCHSDTRRVVIYSILRETTS